MEVFGEPGVERSIGQARYRVPGLFQKARRQDQRLFHIPGHVQKVIVVGPHRLPHQLGHPLSCGLILPVPVEHTLDGPGIPRDLLMYPGRSESFVHRQTDYLAALFGRDFSAAPWVFNHIYILRVYCKYEFTPLDKFVQSPIDKVNCMG